MPSRLLMRASGQAAMEYSLVLAVVVVAVIAASLAFVPAFRRGVESLHGAHGWINWDLPADYCGPGRPAGSC